MQRQPDLCYPLYVDLLAATERYDELWDHNSHVGRAAGLLRAHVPDVDPRTKLHRFSSKFPPSKVALHAYRHYATHLAATGDIAELESWAESPDATNARRVLARWQRLRKMSANRAVSPGRAGQWSGGPARSLTGRCHHDKPRRPTWDSGTNDGRSPAKTRVAGTRG